MYPGLRKCRALNVPCQFWPWKIFGQSRCSAAKAHFSPSTPMATGCRSRPPQVGVVTHSSETTFLLLTSTHLLGAGRKQSHETFIRIYSWIFSSSNMMFPVPIYAKYLLTNLMTCSTSPYPTSLSLQGKSQPFTAVIDVNMYCKLIEGWVLVLIAWIDHLGLVWMSWLNPAILWIKPFIAAGGWSPLSTQTRLSPQEQRLLQPLSLARPRRSTQNHPGNMHPTFLLGFGMTTILSNKTSHMQSTPLLCLGAKLLSPVKVH